MSKVTDQFFLGLLARIAPTATETALVKVREKSLETALQQSLKVKRFFVIGSHSRGSAIRGVSDVDYFSVFAKEDATWGQSLVRSDTLLQNVRQILIQRFPRTEVGKDGQAITLQLTGLHADVVPGIFWGFSQQRRPIYLMPDGKGWWRETSPESHNKFIEAGNVTTRHKLKYVARLVKHWRYCRANPVPISSFHLELLMAAYANQLAFLSYGECLKLVFGWLISRKCAALQDPIGISGLVPCCGSEQMRSRALATLNESYGQAVRACDAEDRGNLTEARKLWSLVFNGQA